MNTLDAVAQKLSEDPAAWQRVQSEVALAANPSARLIELAGEYGMSIDAKELENAIHRAGGELKEDELEAVAGGTLTISSGENTLIGLLLPAVQKVREAASR